MRPLRSPESARNVRFGRPSARRLKARSDCQNVDRCLGMTADQRAKHPECKIKSGRALEAPPKFTFGYYHPLRTEGDAGLPEKIEANKITATFAADNVIGTKIPLRVVANLSGSYAVSGKIGRA